MLTYRARLSPPLLHVLNGRQYDPAMTTEDFQDLLFLCTGSGDQIANPLPNDNPSRRATTERAIENGWVVFVRRIKGYEGVAADVFRITAAGKARLQELGGRKHLSALLKEVRPKR